MIKLLELLNNKILIPRRSEEERSKNYLIATQKKIQQYVKDGGEGNLDLTSTPITSLPSGLKVGGYLDLTYTPIASLPSGLKVRGDLSLTDTLIASLPSDLKVGGSIDLRNTPLSKKYSGGEIRQMVDVKGDIYM
jgi:hypothetical protein